MKNILWLSGGTLSLALGAVGVVLPVLPTTPFILLASVCYAKGSPRAHNWLINHRWAGPIIRDLQSGAGVTKRTKRGALTTIAFTFAVSMLVVPYLYVRIVLPFIGVLVGIHIWRLPTKILDART